MAAEVTDLPALDQLTTPLLIKEINALAEEAGRICQAHALALAAPDEVLRAAAERPVPRDDQARLEAIFSAIAHGKAILAARRLTRERQGQEPTKRR